MAADDNKLSLKLSQNLLEILNNDEEYYDIIIEVGNDPYVKIFRAHLVILYYRSSYLRRILSTSNKKDGTLVHIKLPNISPDIFQVILSYIYGGRISLEEYDASDIVEILVAASELHLQELIDYLQSFLIENKTNLLEQNFNLIYQASFKNNSFLELQNYCINLVSKEPSKIFDSLNFSSIPEKLLVSIIKNDNLQMSEIQVWENVLKWGLAQNPELSSDPTSFSKDDFNTLKNTLQQCIPFIRFYNLSSKEFLEKVLPYKKILPKELHKDLLETFLSLSDPDSKPIDKSKPRIINSRIIDSKIITYQHVELISKWINNDKLTSPYKFKLLFRGSCDGLTPYNFRKICNNQSRTVTIVKVEGSNEILGGYNPIEWRSDNVFGRAEDSFTFSFKNSDRIKDYILSRVMNKAAAICNHPHYGPSFGNFDVTLLGVGRTANKCYCENQAYEKSVRETGNFFVQECEVFLLE